MKSLIKEIEDKFDEIEESNVTANLDGGEGPVKTPNAFAKSKDEDDLDDEHIEVLGYKKSKESKVNTKKLESLESKLEKKINEISYKEFKKDDTRKQHQKINDSIKEINGMMFKLERMVNQNAKLKTEAGAALKDSFPDAEAFLQELFGKAKVATETPAAEEPK